MKNLTKIILILSIAIAFIFSSCEKSIDFQPTTEINSGFALTSTSGLETAVIGAYDRLQSGYLFGGRMWTSGDILAYNVKKSGEYALVYEEIQMMNKEMSPDNLITVVMWIDGYWAINMVNTVIEAIPEVKDEYIEEAKGRIEGECIFIRALVNFEMMRYFQNLKTGDAIPLLTSPTTIDDKPSRASVDGVYNQVIADLQRAVELLPESNSDRATKWAAKALLSRVYFYRGNYQEAANAATEVIESNQFQLVTDSVIKNYRTELSEEIIFAIMSTVGDASCGALNGFFRKVSASAPKFILSDKLVKVFLFTSGYTDTIADKRYNEMVLPIEGKAFTTKFNDRYMSVPLIRLAELYLTRGECRLNLGDMAGAIEDINVIRERATIKPFESSVNLNDFYYERAKELFYEGDNFHNRRRLHKTIKDPNPNNDIEFDWDDYALMFKIPQREIDVNPNLTQNGP